MKIIIALVTFLAALFVTEPSFAGEPTRVDPTRLLEAGEAIARDLLNSYMKSKVGVGFDEVMDLYDILTDDDEQFEPDFDPDEMPQLPAHCAEASTEAVEECDCYDKAFKDLTFVRFYLEKLRWIYGSMKNYSDRMIAFGDAMSGVGGGIGLGWPPERAGIIKSMNKLGRSYDNKYKEYMVTLEKALKKIDECEVKHHDEHNWYGRFGFIYYTFMSDRYKRSE
jgi:hypothetical protein